MKRRSSAVWHGTGLEGGGTLTSTSGVLQNTPYSFAARFKSEDGTAGTNPEELIAAAHAGCYSMALSFGLTNEGFPPNEIRTEAVITVEKQESGFAMTGVHLDVVGDVPRRDRVRRGLHGSRERQGTEDERADAGAARERDGERRAQDTQSDAQGGRRESAAAGTPTEEDVDGGHCVAAVAMRLERDNESPIWKR